VIALVAAAPGAQAARYRGVAYWTYGDKPVALALVKQRLVCARPTRIEAMIDVALGKRPGAARSRQAAPLRAVIAATDIRQDLWAAIVVPPAQADAARQAGFELVGVSVGATLSDRLAIEVKALTATEASAQVLDDQLAGVLPKVTQGLSGIGLDGAAGTVQIDRDGANVRATISLTEAEIRTVVDVVGGAIGMAFGAP
jgi:hypothetical protein